MAPGKAAQAPASAQAQVVFTADKSQAVKKQLSQPFADTSLSMGMQNDSDMADSRQADAGPEDTADVYKSPLQRESTGPKQAGLGMSAVPASQGSSALCFLLNQVLFPRTTADASAANKPCGDPLRFSQSSSLSHMPRQPRLPEDPFDQAAQPAKGLQVCLLVMPLPSCIQCHATLSLQKVLHVHYVLK